MGIDITAFWKDQSEQEVFAQIASWLSVTAGACGYLREAYHGEPYATRHLVAEAFKTGTARIRAATLEARMPQTLHIVEEREKSLYRSDAASIEETKQSFRDFVLLCARKEKETGEPALIRASY